MYRIFYLRDIIYPYRLKSWGEVMRDLRGGVHAERGRGQLAPAYKTYPLHTSIPILDVQGV